METNIPRELIRDVNDIDSMCASFSKYWGQLKASDGHLYFSYEPLISSILNTQLCNSNSITARWSARNKRDCPTSSTVYASTQLVKNYWKTAYGSYGWKMIEKCGESPYTVPNLLSVASVILQPLSLTVYLRWKNLQLNKKKEKRLQTTIIEVTHKHIDNTHSFVCPPSVHLYSSMKIW